MPWKARKKERKRGRGEGEGRNRRRPENREREKGRWRRRREVIRSKKQKSRLGSHIKMYLIMDEGLTYMVPHNTQ